MRYKTKQISVGKVLIGGDSPISVQSMTNSKTSDVKSTIAQIERLQLAGCDIVRLACFDKNDVNALAEIKSNVSLPMVADIHFQYKFAIRASEVVDCIRINPGNIGSKEKIRDVVKACSERKIPIRIGVNGGSLEEEFDKKYGNTPKGMIESALYNIKLLEDFDFTNIKVSLKSSDVLKTIGAYRGLRDKTDYPFHIGVTEAGTIFHSSIKSSMALGNLLMDGIGDTMRVSITGELEKEIEVARAILRYSGRQKNGINLISCPTCGRLHADLINIIKELEPKLKKFKAPLNIAVMGCVVNAIGEAKHADVAIAFGSKKGMIIKRGELIANLREEELIDRFIEEVEIEEKKYFQDS